MHLAARRLKESPLSISEVAYELGCKDVYLFSRQSKEVYGAAPGPSGARSDPQN